ncbi:MAG: hypothetical protein LBI63_03200 [Candidatus Ancillula sp.]|jgi:hypothetical protein|nr:hypothetical protein [Candidatus Ancillula sp.]
MMKGLPLPPGGKVVHHDEVGHWNPNDTDPNKTWVVDKAAYDENDWCGNGSGIGGTSGPGPAGFDEWVNWVLDKKNWNSVTDGGNSGIDVDGAYGAQCVDLSKSWVQSALHLQSPPLLTAIDENGEAVAWGSSPPNGVYQVDKQESIKSGDIIFFRFGHTAVAINNEDGSGRFRVVEQNIPSPHKNAYPKTQVLAVFRIGE